ncbi:MAG: hypothetical protein IJ134_00980 [Bacilli bacterium]|nr:hypothetical protein [Bacilli bacterium]
MKKLTALFFLFILFFVTLPKSSNTLPVSKLEDNQYDIYELEVNNGIKIDDLSDICSDIIILGVYINDSEQYYKFTNFNLKDNISDLKKSFDDTNEIIVNKIIIYTTKNKFDNFLYNNKYLFNN